MPPTASAGELRDHALNSLQGKTAASVPVGIGTPLMEEWNRQLERGLKAAGMNYVLRDPNWDTAKQAEAVQSLINDKPAVLVVHNFDVQILAKLIQQAQQAGIYVIQINIVSNYKSDAFVGADTIDLGRRIADYTPLVKIDKSNWNQPNMCYDGKNDRADRSLIPSPPGRLPPAASRRAPAPERENHDGNCGRAARDTAAPPT